jgi:hypothetical protein
MTVAIRRVGAAGEGTPCPRERRDPADVTRGRWAPMLPGPLVP